MIGEYARALLLFPPSTFPSRLVSGPLLLPSAFTRLSSHRDNFTDRIDIEVYSPVDVVLDNEPDRYDGSQAYPEVDLSEEIKSYWFERGVSIHLSGQLRARDHGLHRCFPTVRE